MSIPSYDEATWLAVLDGVESIYGEAHEPMNPHATIHALRMMHDHYAGMSLTGAVAKHYALLRRQLGLDVAPLPPVSAVTDTWPRLGLSYYTSLTDPRVDPADFATRLQDAGATHTRVWLLDAWAVGQLGTNQYFGYVPWEQTDDGRFDLWKVNQAYLDRLRAYVEAMNAHGILPELSGLELYTWSDRKQNLLWVPDANLGPFRKNKQGVYYADDTAFDRIGQPAGEDAFLGHFYSQVVATLTGLAYAVELANEMPQKELHARLRHLWRAAGYRGTLGVSRNEDSPGQAKNMKIGKLDGYDRIAFHGRRDLAYLDEVYDDEPEYKTFRDFYASGTCDPHRIVLSSDGCRKSTNVEDAYDYDALGAVFTDALARGYSAEHQSALKLRGFVEGRIDLNDLEVDWMLSLRR
jgi:hypothetical protein